MQDGRIPFGKFDRAQIGGDDHRPLRKLTGERGNGAECFHGDSTLRFQRRRVRVHDDEPAGPRGGDRVGDDGAPRACPWALRRSWRA